MLILLKIMENVNSKKRFFPFYFLLFLILVRPSLDIIGEWEISLSKNFPSFNINIILGFFVFFFSAFFLLKNIKKTVRTPLFWPIATFLTVLSASIFYSMDPTASLREIIRLATIFFLYLLAYQVISNKKDFYLLVKVVLLSYLLPSLAALFQYFFGLGLSDQFGGFQRVYGTFAHPNPFAFYSFLIVSLSLALGLKKISQEPKNNQGNNLLFIVLIFVFSLFVLFVTHTRSALACLAVLIFVLGLFKYRKIFLFGFLLFLGVYLFSEVFQQRIWELISLDPYGSVVWRFRLWEDMLPLFLWQPFIGYGLETFTKLAEFYRGFKWGSLEAHNDYLKILIENGILGLISYLWLMLAVLFFLFKKFTQSQKEQKTMALVIFTVFLSLFIAASFDNLLHATALQWNLWIIIASWLKTTHRGLSF